MPGWAVIICVVMISLTAAVLEAANRTSLEVRMPARFSS